MDFSVTISEDLVLRWKSKGYCNKEIARKLSVDLSTIEKHIGNAIRANECANIAQLLCEWARADALLPQKTYIRNTTSKRHRNALPLKD